MSWIPGGIPASEKELNRCQYQHFFERRVRRLRAAEFLFLAIRQYAPGMRLRYWIPAIPCGALPGGEDNARLIFEARAAGKSGFVALDPSEAADVQP
jgi:hypothetical protein